MKKILIATALCSTMFLQNSLDAAAFTVTTAGDANPNGGGNVGDLRYTLNQVNTLGGSNSIDFNLSGGNEIIFLNGLLPILNLNTLCTSLTVNGNNSLGSGSPITIDGTVGGITTYPGLFAQRGTIDLSNMTIQNTIAKGGFGASFGGGGALGAGGGLFINEANVSISNLTFVNNRATGGDRISGGFNGGGGGGGMMGGNGGVTGITTVSGGSGGGGLGGNGGSLAAAGTSDGGSGGGGIAPGGAGGKGYTPSSPSTVGTAGGALGIPASAGGAGGNGGVSLGKAGGATGGGGGGGGSNGANAGSGGGGGGIGGANGVTGGIGVGGAGGAGGFGGGGGGNGGGGASANGGPGGFGGGGGGSATRNGGNGGFGGGGGAGFVASNSTGGNGGFGASGGGASIVGLSGVGAGTVISGTAVSGGAAFGAAIFVNGSTNPSYYNSSTGGNGSLTVTGPLSISAGVLTPGTGANASAASGAAIFATQGTVPLTFTISTLATSTVNGTIGDDSAYTLPGGTYTPGAAVGAKLLSNGPGTLVLTAANTYSGGTELSNGTVKIGNASALGNPAKSVDFTGNTILQTEAAMTLLYPMTISPGVTATVNTNAFNVTATGIISGGGALIKIGLGDLTLTGNNTFTGGIIIDEGVLAVTTASLPVATIQPSVQINTLGELEFINAASGSYSGDILNNGVLSNSGNGTLTLSGLISGNGLIDMFGNGTLKFTVTSNFTGDIVNDDEVEFFEPSNETYAGSISLPVFGSLITKTGAGELTLDGPITGIGGVDVAEGKLILNSSGNSYSGGTNVFTAAILEGNSSSLQGTIALDQSTVSFNQQSTGSFNGTITNTSPADQILKTGPGTLLFNINMGAFQGITNISQGILSLNNALGGQVNVLNNGTLAGNGTVVGNLNIYAGGTISPGDSIGTITVTGNYSQAHDGVYYAEINGSGQSDLINIGGSAFISGTVVINSLDGVINPSVIYTILHADGGVFGTYDTVISTNPMLFPRIIYTANDVQIGIESTFTIIATTNNEEQVAFQLENVQNPSPALQAIINELLALGDSPATIALAQQALEQMSGQQYTTLLSSAEITGRQFIRRLYDPLRSTVTTVPCAQMCCCPTTFAAWIESGGGKSTFEGNRNTRGLKASGYEISAGAQNAFNCKWTAGIAASYAKDQIHYNVGGSGQNRTGLGAIYGLYRDTAGYILADLAFGYSKDSVKRTINIGDLRYTARSKPKITQEIGYIEAGFDYACNSLLIQPFLGFEVGAYHLQQIKEHGADPINLIVSKKNYANVHSRLGAHLTTNVISCFSLSLDLAWQCRLTSPKNNAIERFQSFGDKFIITGGPVGRNSIDAALAITASLWNGFELYAEIAGEKWSHNSNYNATGGIKFSW